MANNVEGPLYYERMGRTGPVMAFVHPNPMDQSCWIFQMAHLSTWYRCIAIDIPGYGRSPKAGAGLTMDDMAEACWEAIDDAIARRGRHPRGLLRWDRPYRRLTCITSTRTGRRRSSCRATGYSTDKSNFAKRRIADLPRQWHRLSLERTRSRT